MSLGLWVLPISAAATDLSFKLEPGVAIPLSAPQSQVYDIGGVLLARFGHGGRGRPEGGGRVSGHRLPKYSRQLLRRPLESARRYDIPMRFVQGGPR
ncbi:hypothetical protein KH5H1_24550 [Corallococcus caeni]|nr:hypothetical protein KH5H1_24550 [Corallococcus sp. KH5-1]